MGMSRRSALIVCLLTISLVSGFAHGATATQATVLTNLGGVADGTLTGLAPTIQLRAPDEVTVIGPMQQYDIPLSAIRQISLDFPRLVIETETGVVIGPYSAFRGIDEVLTLATGVGTTSIRIPVTSVRAIALHGSTLRAVPREWMGDHFLSTPEIVSASPLPTEDCDNCTITIPATSDGDSIPIWNTITPEVPLEEPGELPGWMGLLAVAALVILFILVSSSLSSS